jgi:hypothetical protein
MRKMRIDQCLVKWMLDFMSDRSVKMVVDGQEGTQFAVNMGLPQGSPVSPVLFAIYMADIHQAIEEAIEGSSGLSFIDDVTWLIEASGIPQLIRKMEKYARLCQAWAQRNTVRFETSKVEAILLSRNRKHYKERDTMKVRVGEHHAKFNSGATRWLGVWIDLALRLTTHQDKCMARARMAEN